jgi:hypothetical protein
MVYNAEIKAREKWKGLPNVEIVSWSPEEQAKARAVGHKVVLDEAQKSPEGQEFLDIYRTALWELGYKEDAKVLGYTE